MSRQPTCKLKLIQDGALAVPRTCPGCGLFGTCRLGLVAVPKNPAPQDPIQANLSKLSSPTPGMVVRLPEGEELKVWENEDELSCGGRLWIGPMDLSHPAALPLLRAAVAGGAEVILPGEGK